MKLLNSISRLWSKSRQPKNAPRHPIQLIAAAVNDELSQHTKCVVTRLSFKLADGSLMTLDTYVFRGNVEGPHRDFLQDIVHKKSTLPTGAMTMDELMVILSEISFPNIRVVALDAGLSFLIHLEFDALDASSGRTEKQKSRKWWVSRHSTKSEVVQTVFKAFLTALEHEAREDFRYRGQAIFGPHFDVDDLALRMPETEVRA